MAQKDVTSTYITNATLSAGMNSGWTVTYTGSGNYNHFNTVAQGNNTVGYATEAYAGWNELAYTAYSMTQTITLPAGNYRLVNYSFFRQGQNADTDASKSLAYLKAGEEQVAIKTLGSITAAGYANSQAEGANCFDSKMYRNVVEFTSDGTTPIEIGVYGTFDAAYSWCIVGQFELFDLDDAASVSSPTDMTYKITNPGFEYRDLSGWTNNGFAYVDDNDNIGGKSGKAYIEYYKWGGLENDKSISQTLTGMDNGLYEVTVYGHQQQGTPNDGVKLYANDDFTYIGSTTQDYSVRTTVNDGELTIMIKTEGSTANWTAFDKFRLKFYGDPLAAYQELLDAAVDEAKDLIADAAIPSAAKTAWQAVVDDNDNDDKTFTEESQFSTAIANIEAANTTYQALENPYSVWQMVKSLADDLTGLAYAETVSGSHTTFTDAISAQNTAAEASTTAGAINTASDALKTAIKTYMSGATLTFVSEIDFTCMIENPSFETGDFTGWTNTGMAAQNNTSFGKTGTYYAEKWEPADDTKYGVKQTISNLPAGSYIVSAHAKARAVESAKVYAGSKEAAVTIADSEKDYDVEFVSTGSDVEIGFEAEGNGTGSSWLCVDNFTLTYQGYAATSEEKTALDAAITAAEDKTLGFEAGEYAPYENVDALTKLATAKAIDTETASGSAVVAATTALTGANWTANVGSVECVYNGNFAEGQGSSAANIQQYGWTRTNGWGQFRNDVYGSTTGYYNQPGSLQYGNAGVYTMPLEANTIYNLTFKYGSWEANSNDGMTVSVLNSEDGMAAMSFDAYKTKYTDGLATQSLVFVTGAAGNYILTLANSGNTVITGVSITKAASQVLEFADGSVPAYAPGTYPTVKITRTLTADMWATGVYPFAISGVDGLTTVNMSAFEGDVLTFSEGATVANQPFLMKASSTKSEINLTNVAVAATSGAANHTIGDITMKGVYAAGTVSASEESTYRYIVDSSNNTLRKVVDGGTGVNINPYRAYFELSGIDVNNARSNIRMNFGGITGVENIEAAPVAKAKKNGAYLENGKIAIYKNGMKFSATGAKLK